MDGLIAYALAKKYADKVGQSILDAGFKVQVEQDRSVLNRTGEQMTLYLLPKESSLSSDTYDEYVYTTKWEQVGSTDIELDYNDLENKPKISYNMGTSSSMTESLIGRLAFGSGIRIEKTTDGTENFFAFKVDPSKVFTAVRGNTNLDLNSTVSQPFLFVAKRYRFTNLPSFVSVGNNDDIGLLNLSGQDIGQSMQMLYWIDSNNNSRYAFRVRYSQWREIKDGSTIVSGVVNQNGTITFTDSDDNTFTTTGDKLMTSGNQQISMGYDNGGFYFLFDDGQEVTNNGSN